MVFKEANNSGNSMTQIKVHRSVNINRPNSCYMHYTQVSRVTIFKKSFMLRAI